MHSMQDIHKEARPASSLATAVRLSPRSSAVHPPEMPPVRRVSCTYRLRRHWTDSDDDDSTTPSVSLFSHPPQHKQESSAVATGPCPICGMRTFQLWRCIADRSLVQCSRCLVSPKHRWYIIFPLTPGFSVAHNWYFTPNAEWEPAAQRDTKAQEADFMILENRITDRLRALDVHERCILMSKPVDPGVDQITRMINRILVRYQKNHHV